MGAITDHSQNSDCYLDDGVRRYPGYALLGGQRHLDASAMNARPDVLAFLASGYFNLH